jgi:isoleucyl-tRNA synthetase
MTDRPFVWESRQGGLERAASLYAALPAANNLAARWSFLEGKVVRLVTWTSAPWTLLTPFALKCHPDTEYVFYSLGRQVLVIAKAMLVAVLHDVAPDELKARKVELAARAIEAAGLAEPQRILGHALGRELEHLRYRSFLTCPGAGLASEVGTGLVVAPAFTRPGSGPSNRMRVSPPCGGPQT